MTELTELTLVEAQRRIARRELAALELVEATLEHIERTEPSLHAYAEVLADASLADAALLDREAEAGSVRGPLHGIPIGVKDNIYVRGAPLRAGSRALREFVPDVDAACVVRLREAGAVIVGKTVTHEFAYAAERGDGPETRNPWRPGFLPGGSSAGSAAATAARSAFGALGTDTAGSIRGPSSWNGVVGLKPTYGRVSRHGVIPLSPSLDHVGAMARTVADCAALFAAMSGSDPRDAASAAVGGHVNAERSEGLAGLRVGVGSDYFFGEALDDEVRELVEASVLSFGELGATVVNVSAAWLEPIASVGLVIVMVEASEYHRSRFLADPEAYCPGNRSLLELGERVPAVDYVAARRARPAFRDLMHRLFRDERLDLLVAPVYPVASRRRESVAELGIPGALDLHSLVRCTIPANVTGQPALAIPCGFTTEGLPVDVQLLGRPFDEPTLFAAAQAYESAHSWIERRPDLDAFAPESLM
jgi:aspartyl-tRNA(Asn)/glutamyl-tRNA(Gln) amidotransferase subunit A